jgi:hypothetical protein
MGVHMNILCSATKVLWKKDISFGLCKKSRKMKFCSIKDCSFTQNIQIVFFSPNLVVNIKFLDIHQEFVIIFDILKNVLSRGFKKEW